MWRHVIVQQPADLMREQILECQLLPFRLLQASLARLSMRMWQRGQRLDASQGLVYVLSQVRWSYHEPRMGLSESACRRAYCCRYKFQIRWNPSENFRSHSPLFLRLLDLRRFEQCLHRRQSKSCPHSRS